VSTDNTQRRNRAIAALKAVPTHYGENEEGITDAITDLLHLAAKQGVDVEELLSRCHDNYETETAGEEEAKTNQRYALVVVVEADSPEQAWEAVNGTAGGLEGDSEPDCIYIGAPWQGIPPDAEDLGTERLTLGMSLPNGQGQFVSAFAVLKPCD
jgi:hypothetical protein